MNSNNNVNKKINIPRPKLERSTNNWCYDINIPKSNLERTTNSHFYNNQLYTNINYSEIKNDISFNISSNLPIISYESYHKKYISSSNYN